MATDQALDEIRFVAPNLFYEKFTYRSSNDGGKFVTYKSVISLILYDLYNEDIYVKILDYDMDAKDSRIDLLR